MRSIALALLIAAGARLGAQQPAAPAGAQAGAPPGATITGTVYDSLSHRPFADADVQFLRTDGDSTVARRSFTVTADSAGGYRLTDVPPGIYLAGFFHPRLDSLGFEAPARQIEIRPGQAARVDFSLPGAARLARTVCPPKSVSDSTALLFGFVRDATTREPRPGAFVRLGWLRIVFDAGGLRQDEPTVDVRTLRNGWFAACGVPGSTPLRLRAYDGADTTGVVLMEMSGGDVVHRDLYVGRTAIVAGGDSARRATDEAPRSGSGRLLGVVRSAAGRPVVGARVRLWEGAHSAVTTETGTFTLATLPVGSQTLDVRAVGYLPVRQTVDLLATGDPTRVSVTLTSFKAYLDTVRVTRRRVYSLDRSGFEARRRSSATGRFLSRDAIDRERAIRTSDLFRMMPGVRVTPGRFGGDRVTMRGNRGEDCAPEIYLDGMSLSMGVDGSGSGMSDLDLVSPSDLDGVEVYAHAATAPAEYSRVLSGCGTILLWTHPPDPKPPRSKER